VTAALETAGPGARATGLLLAGQLVQVPGVTVLAPASHGGPPRCRLQSGDYRARARPPVQLLLHATKGTWPQHVKPGAGPPGRELAVADYWAQDPVHSAAHIVIGSDGTVACLGDLVRDEAFHATVSNPYSVGIELYQEADGGIWGRRSSRWCGSRRCSATRWRSRSRSSPIRTRGIRCRGSWTAG